MSIPGDPGEIGVGGQIAGNMHLASLLVDGAVSAATLEAAGVAAKGLFIASRVNGSSGAYRRVQSGDIIGEFQARGGYAPDDVSDVADEGSNAVIRVTATGNWTSTAQPYKVQVYTRQSSDGSEVLWAELSDDGKLKLPGLVASRALATDSSKQLASSDTTATELGYLSGVTSGVQTQLNGKASSSHSHAAADITSGTLDGDRLPAMSSTKLGGVPATGAPSNKFLRDDGSWQSAGSATINSSAVNLPMVVGSTQITDEDVDTLTLATQPLYGGGAVTWSSGLTVAVTAGKGFIRATNSMSAQLTGVTWNANAALAVSYGDNWVVVDGLGLRVVTSYSSYTDQTTIFLAKVTMSGPPASGVVTDLRPYASNKFWRSDRSWSALVAGDIPDLSATYVAGNVLTTRGDLLTRNASVPTRLAVGAAGTVLVGGTDPTYSATPQVTALGVGTAAGASGVKLVAGSIIYPGADSTTALKVTKADGSTVMQQWDTVNGYIGFPSGSNLISITPGVGSGRLYFGGSYKSYISAGAADGSGLRFLTSSGTVPGEIIFYKAVSAAGAAASSITFTEIGGADAINPSANGFIIQNGGITESGSYKFPVFTITFRAATVTDPTDAEWKLSAINGVVTASSLNFSSKVSSSQTGETQGAVRFTTNVADALLVGRNGNVGINGITAFGTNAIGVFGIKNGTAPASSPADAVQLYSADVSASAVPHFRTEAGDVIKLYKLAALTSKLTTLTYTAPGTPDYAIADLTNSSPYGFASQDEGRTVLSVIANLQARVNDLEARLQTLGVVS